VIQTEKAMKSKTEYLTFNTPARRAFINITPDVRRIVTASGVKEGICLVNAMHISASVFVNDDEHGLHQDFDILFAQPRGPVRSRVCCRWIAPRPPAALRSAIA